MDNKKIADSASQKKTYKFNFIDFVLIVVIIAAVSLLIYIMLGNNLLMGSEDTIILYTIEIREIRNDFLGSIDLLTKGTTIIDSVRSYNIGEVQKVTVTDAYANATDLENGVVVSKQYPDHKKVTITVKAKCKRDKAKYEVNGKIIMVGTRLDFRTPYLVSYGNCVDIVEINEDGSPKNSTKSETTEEILDMDIGG